ncbi:MAG: hypothetical protein J6I45_12490 [Clostridia bacterium]|nr:hypothetical protein [Clostridia bacterium]
MKKRILSLLLAALMLIPMTACNDPENNDIAENNDTTVASDASGNEAETSEYDALVADLPTGNYDGYKFMMLNNESNFALTQMDADEQTGEPINDAIYKRNAAVAERLNIDISENMVGYAEVTNIMSKSIAAEEDTYSCFWNESYLVAPFAIDGKLQNINGISAINLEKLWWDGDALEEIAFGDYQYFLVGDIHLMFKEAFYMMAFNKGILADNSLAVPYDMVRDGKWTMDVMQSYMKTAKLDLNGDSVIDGYDRFGMTSTALCAYGLFISSGELFVERGNDGIPALVQPDERFYSVYEKILGMTTAHSADYACISGLTKNLSIYQNDFHDVFHVGNALFYLEPLGSLKKFRDSDVEFGVLPLPKYDEAQEDYHTYITNLAALCGIPITADSERTGVILENLAAESCVELRDTYMDVTLKSKYIRDEESVEMLELILDSGRFSLTDILSVSDPVDVISQNLTARKSDLSSKYAAIMDRAAKKVEDNVKKLMKSE